MKVHKAILHTKGLDSQFAGEVSTEEITVYKLIYDMMDGKEAIVIPCNGEYHFVGLADGKADKELSYQMEQDPFMGCYVDQREEFDRDYDAGEYSRDCIFCLPVTAVEVIQSAGQDRELPFETVGVVEPEV